MSYADLTAHPTDAREIYNSTRDPHVKNTAVHYIHVHTQFN